jgi:hypothetical protein
VSEQNHPFVAGIAVVVQENYSHYDEGTFRPDTVLKVHKSGRFTLTSDPKKQWTAEPHWGEGEGKPRFAWPTGRTGYSIYSTRLRLHDDAAHAEMEKAKAKREHQKRCKAIADAFAKPDKVSPELSTTVAAMVAANEPVQ